jgi:glucosamine-6-phosphate deaminase
MTMGSALDQGMRVVVCDSAESLGRYAAAEAAAGLARALSRGDRARLLLSTGQSQFETLRELVRKPLDWSRVDAFHLDEYVGLPREHPASFRRYLHERVASLIPVQMHYVDPSSPGDLQSLKDDAAGPMDVALIGIGENGHIAFNDPPADFESQETYIEVDLAERCRLQQVGEGWFDDLEDVPGRAITMSVSAILRSRMIVSAVPHSAKAESIKRLLTAVVVSPDLPASALIGHPDALLVIDRSSSQLLPEEVWRQCVVL